MQHRGAKYCILLAVLLLIPLFPQSARAWGPGAHSATARWLLGYAEVLALPMGALLLRYPRQFLHGILSADIFIGKGCKAKKGHSHNWESAFALLAGACGGAERSFAYGYICHLAADVVAHNVFVPGLMHTLPGGGRFGHVYLETQADRLLAWESAEALRALTARSSKGPARLLRLTMKQKNSVFWMRKLMFKSCLRLGGANIWRNSMLMLDRAVAARDRTELLDGLFSLSAAAMLSVLREPEASPLLELDPIGSKRLAEAASGSLACLSGAGLFSPASREALPLRAELSVSIPEVLRALPLDEIPSRWTGPAPWRAGAMLPDMKGALFELPRVR